jgi:hypothetical protein
LALEAERISLFDVRGERLHGSENREVAEHTLARIQHSGETNCPIAVVEPDWNVARVCSEYFQSRERSVASVSMSRSHRNHSVAFLNDLCGYSGALTVTKQKKNLVQTWLEGHAGRRSLAPHRSVIHPKKHLKYKYARAVASLL